MSRILSRIQMVEDNWYSLLLSHIESLYLNHHLPSHDVGHHQRVWGYVKELLEEIDSKGIEVSNQLIEQAIVASFFHDTGLLLDNSERHGYKSRLLCEQFFKENPKLAIQGLEEVLNAIEHHDDKTLKIKNDVENNVTSVDLLTLISTADDLDAFGLVGVYRYWEIYSLRGVPKSEIPQRVIINLTNRLENFKGYFSYLENFVIHQEKRYSKTLKFYSTLLTLGEKSLTTNSYEIEVIKLLESLLINSKFEIEKVIDYVLSTDHDDNVKDYFKDLKAELEGISVKPT